LCVIFYLKKVTIYLMAASMKVTCFLLIMIYVCAVQGHDLTLNDGTDVVNVISVEATGHKKLQLNWELRARTGKAEEFMIQLEACPDSGQCHHEQRMYLPATVFTREIRCEECLHYIVRITAVDFDRKCLGEDDFWASFVDHTRDLSVDSEKTLTPEEDLQEGDLQEGDLWKVMEEVLVKADKDTELSLKDTEADTELSYNPGNMTMISYPDSDKLDMIVPATEEKDLKDLIIYASLATAVFLLVSLVVVLILLRRLRAQRNNYDCEQGKKSAIQPVAEMNGKNRLKLRLSLLPVGEEPEEEEQAGFAQRVEDRHLKTIRYSVSEPQSP